MMKRSVLVKPQPSRTWVVLALAVWLAACSTNKSLFVLMPDENGEVGAIEVSNPQGSVTLTEAGQTAEVKSATSRVTVADDAMSDQEIQEVFGDALAVVPQPPRIFTIQFKSDSAGLDVASRDLLEDVAKEISSRDSLDISVNGHSDRTGESEHNRRLSLERAEVVRDRLAALGVDPNRITVAYHGEGDPVVPTENGVAEPRNRRVEIIVR